MIEHFMIYNKGIKIFRGNIIEIIDKMFELSNEIGCSKPNFIDTDNDNQIIFEGKYCDVKFEIKKVEDTI